MARDKVLHELREDCECQGSKYCPLEAIVATFKDRFLEQHKCVEKFKMEESKAEGRDIGWHNAYLQWAEKGYAKRFAEVYSDDKSFRQIYKEVMNR